jgi:hypothetical protein
MTTNTVSRQVRLLTRFLGHEFSQATIRTTADGSADWYEFVRSAFETLSRLGFIARVQGMPTVGLTPEEWWFELTEKGFRHLAEIALYEKVLREELERSLARTELKIEVVSASSRHGR